MEGNDLNKLLKSDTLSNVNPIKNKRLTYSKRTLYNICCSLSYDTINFKPSNTLSIIEEYTSSKDRLPRILYSEITNYVYSLSSEGRGIFATNVESLLNYVMFCPQSARPNFGDFLLSEKINLTNRSRHDIIKPSKGDNHMKVNFHFSANSFVDVDLDEKDAERVDRGDLKSLSDEAYEKILNAFNSFDIDRVRLTRIWK